MSSTEGIEPAKGFLELLGKQLKAKKEKTKEEPSKEEA
jgi:hypothetical protein